MAGPERKSRLLSDKERQVVAYHESGHTLVAKLTPGSWQGPVESGFGWHLVFVDTLIPGRLPAFEEVEADVKIAWLAEQKAQAWQKAYQDMRAKYTVLLPAPAENASVNRDTSHNEQSPSPSEDRS